ncbi:MAG: hypothetical protein J5I90_10525 [Caldilineales bacterium]|nr:hypothetical protein [Caldilineales bacterium]
MNPETMFNFSLAALDARVLILAAAVLAALTAFVTARRLKPDLWWRSRSNQVLAYTENAGDSPLPGPDIHLNQEAIILQSLGLPYRPRLLLTLRLLAGLAPALILLALGYPLVLALGGGVLFAILAGTWLQGRWRKFCNAIEQELPTFTSRLSGTLLVTASPVAALEDINAGLAATAPLRLWMDAFLRGLRQPGRQPFLTSAQQEAEVISVSLALVVFEIGRLLETGGSGFTQAFTATAEHLTSILRARAVARAKAEAARSAVLTMLAIMGVVVLIMLSAEQNRVAYQDPFVQAFTLICLAVMALGYVLLNNMIDEALED